MIPVLPPVIGNYYLLDILGSGFSGTIYRASHIFTGHIVALKVQDVNHECPTNSYERWIYPQLQGGVGMPTLWAAGVHDRWSYLAIDLLGPSLEKMISAANLDCLDLRSVCCIAAQVITRLEFMHSRGILHRDIQLGNCVLGMPGTPIETTIFMIDFGFSKRYIDSSKRRHIPDSKTKRDFVGNYWFSSVGVHCRGKVPSRRDDMEAVALMLIHLLTPRGLSWTRNGIPKTDMAHERLKREKQSARPEDLCRGLPTEFEDFLRYCRRLKFTECPDYWRWVDEFRQLAKRRGFPSGDALIWPPPPESIVQPLHSRTPRRTMGTASVEKALAELANLNLDDRPVLRDLKNIPDAVRPASKTKELTVISDSSEEKPVKPPRRRGAPKAEQLRGLARLTPNAKTNAALSDLVSGFVSVLMRANSSRTLTREGFAFLEALCAQLTDPEVPRKRTQRTSDKEQVPPAEIKLGVVARLKREVCRAGSNSELAKMVAEFCAVTKRSTGRTVTKDGFAFLNGLAEALLKM